MFWNNFCLTYREDLDLQRQQKHCTLIKNVWKLKEKNHNKKQLFHQWQGKFETGMDSLKLQELLCQQLFKILIIILKSREKILCYQASNRWQHYEVFSIYSRNVMFQMHISIIPVKQNPTLHRGTSTSSPRRLTFQSFLGCILWSCVSAMKENTCIRRMIVKQLSTTTSCMAASKSFFGKLLQSMCSRVYVTK